MNIRTIPSLSVIIFMISLPLLSLLVCTQRVLAQEELPREFTNPEELVSFDRQTQFQDALDVIDFFSREYRGKFILDRTGFQGPIGINLPPIHWEDALDYILRVQDMILIEESDYVEIMTRQQAEQVSAGRPAGAAATGDAATQVATAETREVRINATFFEGNRRALREIGVDWSTITNNVPGEILDYVGDEGSGELPSTQFDGRFVQVNARNAQSVSQNVFNSLINFGNIGAGIEVQALFSAFEADNLGEVLATPSVKVMDGSTGRIQVGQDFSIKQRDIAGNVMDQFFQTGTILTVTPQVITEGGDTFIYLELDVERSSAQPDPVSTVINKEEASTYTLLLDGESTVIAGLFRTDHSEVRRGIPILKDLPGWFFGLKYLFGYNSTDVSQSELIVIVQAELEKSISERMEEQIQSSRTLLERQQAIHREGLDYMPVQNRESVRLPDAEVADPLAADGPVMRQRIFSEDDLPEGRQTAGVSVQEGTAVPGSELNDPGNQPEAGEAGSEYQNEEELVYFTIGGTFANRSSAMDLYRNFTDQGYQPHLLYSPGTGYYFVAYKGFLEYDSALTFTRMIQRDVQEEAWLSEITTEEQLIPDGISRD